MDSMNNTYNDYEDYHMNVFGELLHYLFKTSSCHHEPVKIDLVVPTHKDMKKCGYCLVRNIGCILKGGIVLMYTQLYNGNKFSDYFTRIDLYIKEAGLDYHTDSITYI